MEALIPAIKSTISNMTDDFTTHELIIQLAKTEQHAYIEALHDNLGSENPFQSLHSKIGKFLSQSDRVITSSEFKRDTDIFGQTSNSPIWKKVP